MKVETLGAALIATGLVVVSPAYGQEECPVGRPEILVRGIIPVTGDGPLWVAVGSGTISWIGPNEGVTAYGAKKRPRLGRCWSSLPSSLRLCRLRCSSSSSCSLAG